VTDAFNPGLRANADNTVTPSPENGAGSILSEAARIVEGVRNQQHGDKERSFVAIAIMWDAYLSARRVPQGRIRAQDVAHMMALMKKMRAEWGSPIRDHFVDDAGYTGIAGELSIPAPAQAQAQAAERLGSPPFPWKPSTVDMIAGLEADRAMRAKVEEERERLAALRKNPPLGGAQEG
jgi:hypothetical protein